jgi:hypothetical protein
MKNITVSVGEEVYHAARVEAARRRKSLSALVRDFLGGLQPEDPMKDDGRAGKASVRSAETEERNRLMESLLRRTAHFRVGRKPTREEMNER